MNTTTKTWLLDVLDAEERRLREKCNAAPYLWNEQLSNGMARINAARELVRKYPEEP